MAFGLCDGLALEGGLSPLVRWKGGGEEGQGSARSTCDRTGKASSKFNKPMFML